MRGVSAADEKALLLLIHTYSNIFRTVFQDIWFPLITQFTAIDFFGVLCVLFYF